MSAPVPCSEQASSDCAAIAGALFIGSGYWRAKASPRNGHIDRDISSRQSRFDEWRSNRLWLKLKMAAVMRKKIVVIGNGMAGTRTISAKLGREEELAALKTALPFLSRSECFRIGAPSEGVRNSQPRYGHSGSDPNFEMRCSAGFLLALSITYAEAYRFETRGGCFRLPSASSKTEVLQ